MLMPQPCGLLGVLQETKKSILGKQVQRSGTCLPKMDFLVSCSALNGWAVWECWRENLQEDRWQTCSIL